MKTALFSAFPQELTYIIKSLGAKRVRAGSSPFITLSARIASGEIIIVQSGMGTMNSEAAWSYAAGEFRPEYIISAGFCGALYDGAGIGDLVAATSVSLYPDNCNIEIPGAKEAIRTISGSVAVHEGNILTLSQRLNKSEIRKELLRGLSFPVCDMETFSLAKLSIRDGLPFFAVRAVTDRIHEEIPRELFGVTDENGSFSLLRAMGTMLAHPALIPQCMRLEKNSRAASQKLGLAVEALLRIL